MSDRPAIKILPAHLSIGVPALALLAEALFDLSLLPPFPSLAMIVPGAALVLVSGLVTRNAARAFAAVETPIDPRQDVLALARSGPYRFTRNPMYLCMVMLQAGLYLAFSLDFGVLLLPVLWAGLHFGVVLPEERFLTARFGSAYTDYLAETRRWL